jgi:CYTH domain-containing protein
MEIERKFRIYRNQIPFDISEFPSKEIRQGYILHSPALRIRKENEDYILTYKGRGSLSREEINITLPEAAGEKLFTKCDGHLIDKTRYLIPANAKDATSGRDLVIELDIFHGEFDSLCYAEVEFDSEESANSYIVPDWFGKDLTGIHGFSNSDLSKYGLPADI